MDKTRFNVFLLQYIMSEWFFEQNIRSAKYLVLHKVRKTFKHSHNDSNQLHTRKPLKKILERKKVWSFFERNVVKSSIRGDCFHRVQRCHQSTHTVDSMNVRVCQIDLQGSHIFMCNFDKAQFCKFDVQIWLFLT